jgi:hypothetical protein
VVRRAALYLRLFFFLSFDRMITSRTKMLMKSAEFENGGKSQQTTACALEEVGREASLVDAPRKSSSE